MKNNKEWKFFEQDLAWIVKEIEKLNLSIDKVYGSPKDGKPIASRLASIMDKPLTYVRKDITENTLEVEDNLQAKKTDFKHNNKKILTIYYKGRGK